MILKTVAIENFRSLERVQLGRLGLFNVLIGRNNSGKSAILNALDFLRRVNHGELSDWSTVLTHRDQRRALRIVLTFELGPTDRSEFLKRCRLTDALRAQLSDTALARRIEYEFRSPTGVPKALHLVATRILNARGEFATIQRTARPLVDGAVTAVTKQIQALKTEAEFAEGLDVDRVLSNNAEAGQDVN